MAQYITAYRFMAIAIDQGIAYAQYALQALEAQKFVYDEQLFNRVKSLLTFPLKG